MSETEAWSEFSEVTCPFCGLCCDDLRVKVVNGRPEVLANGCTLSRQQFAYAAADSENVTMLSQIDGKPSTLEAATQRAAELLREAKLPVIGGLGTDVSGMRAALRLADRCGAVVDHMNSAGMIRNLRVLQDSGWMTATLTEVRNRADTVIIIGNKIFDAFPRLLERVLIPYHVHKTDEQNPLFLEDTNSRELILIGPWQEKSLPVELAGLRPTVVSLPIERMGETAGLLRAIRAGVPLQADSATGFDIVLLSDLATKLARAHYAVVTWFAGELDFPHAELAIETWSELIRELNADIRCVALPLGGNQGDLTANQVALWQSGYPVRTAFSCGYPDYDPHLYDGGRLLENGEADALLWLSSYSAQALPPAVDAPTIVVGHPRMKFQQQPQIYIPVGIPGIDHSGHLFRADNVVALPLKPLRFGQWPAAKTVLHEISNRL